MCAYTHTSHLTTMAAKLQSHNINTHDENAHINVRVFYLRYSCERRVSVGYI